MAAKIRPQDRPPSVTRQVADHLARLIVSGTLAAGERLPGETVLARRFGVSRPTVREALSRLERRRLVEIRPRSGTYVLAPEERPGASVLDGLLQLEPGDLWELLELRRILEPEAAALAARRRSTEDLSRLRALLRPLEGLGGRELLERPGTSRAYGRFFDLLARAAHNDLMTRLTETLGGMLRDALAYSHMRLTGRPGAIATIRDQLLAVLLAVEAREGEEARAETAAHLAFVERTLREIEAEGG